MSSFLTRNVLSAPRLARAFSSTPARPYAKITILGNLVTPVEMHATSTGRDMLRYVIASNIGRGDKSKSSYFRVTCFDNASARRDYLQSLGKGSLLYIEAEASLRSYETSEGKQSTSLSIIQRHFEVLRKVPSKEDGGEGEGEGEAEAEADQSSEH